MKQFTLTKQDLHTIIVNIGGKTGGNDVPDLRKIAEIRGALTPFCQDFIDVLDEISTAARDAQDEADDEGELTEVRAAEIHRRANRAASRVNDALGKEDVLVRLDDHGVHQSMVDRWKAIAGWPGDEKTQTRVLRITDAIEGATAMKFDDEAKEWVPSEKGDADAKLRQFARPVKKSVGKRTG